MHRITVTASYAGQAYTVSANYQPTEEPETIDRPVDQYRYIKVTVNGPTATCKMVDRATGTVTANMPVTQVRRDFNVTESLSYRPDQDDYGDDEADD